MTRNRDDVTEVAGFTDNESIFLPDTALRADLIVDRRPAIGAHPRVVGEQKIVREVLQRQAEQEREKPPEHQALLAEAAGQGPDQDALHQGRQHSDVKEYEADRADEGVAGTDWRTRKSC